MGELLEVNGAHWDREMGAITQMLTEGGKGKAPAILFDEVPGYPKGYRTLYGQFSTIKRVALTLGLPLEYEHKADIVKAYHHVMTDMKLLKPKMVKTGPIFENVLEGDKVDVLKLPVPIHHQADTHRYIGTADMCITKDPDAEWYNFGAYRCEVYDGKTIGCQITEGKHGRIHRDKYFERGQSCKFAIVCGQDPLLYLLSASPLPSGVSEYDFAGGIRGEPVEVVKGPFTGFPIPADAEIVIEGEAVPGQSQPEGPFGEWMGYYSDDVVPRPYLNVKTVMYRNNPILTCAPQHKPVDETGLLKGIAGAAEIWNALEACGLPEILGVWNHEGAPATRFTAIQIRQRYPGHARNVLARRVQLHGRRVQRQVDRGGRRRRRLLGYRSSALGYGHALRSDHRHRSRAEGLVFGPRSDVLAGQFQQPHLDRRLPAVQSQTAKASFPRSSKCRKITAAKMKAKFPQIFK